MNTAIFAAKLSIAIFLTYFGAEKLKLCWRDNSGRPLWGQSVLAAITLGCGLAIVAEMMGLVAS